VLWCLRSSSLIFWRRAMNLLHRPGRYCSPPHGNTLNLRDEG
jgi:hypothetical protein